jgi:hypothetical protein
MQVKQLTVRRFRGIRHLRWSPRSPIACLVGPGDSTKTTILDALELALSPRWTVPVTDADFHLGNTSQPILIEVTVADLPPSLLSEDKYGMYLRGWTGESKLRDEPEDEDESVLTIRFTVDDSLEPAWLVVNKREPDGRHIRARDREALGLARLGNDIDRHLAWMRGSALSRSTDGLEEIGKVVAAAQREARRAVAGADLTKLKTTARKARRAATRLGVRAVGDFHPALDSHLGMGGAGQLSLHEDEIPLRAAGLGTKRLSALALQLLAVKEGAILLVDEVEHGLEPHRLRHLLQVLRNGSDGQVFMTTHAPVPVAELPAEALYVVRCDKGLTRVRHVSAELQSLVRKEPAALLARRVLVCEGRTELGLCRGLSGPWGDSRGRPVAHTGTALADGGGSEAPGIAQRLACLGYDTAVLADSDKPLKPDVATLEESGVEVIQWGEGMSTEERIASDVPLAALQECVDYAIDTHGKASIIDAINARLPSTDGLMGDDIATWAKQLGEREVRSAIGRAAKKKGWFKQVDRAETVGAIVARVLPGIRRTDLAKKLGRLAEWIYAD